MILQGAGDDFGGRGRAAVDQDDHGLAVGDIALLRVEALGFVGMAAAGRDNFALVEEAVGDGNRLVEQAARIVAEIDDIALDLAAHLGFHAGKGLFEAFLGLLGERADAHIADVLLGAFEIGLHRLHANAVADELDVEWPPDPCAGW